MGSLLCSWGTRAERAVTMKVIAFASANIVFVELATMTATVINRLIVKGCGAGLKQYQVYGCRE
jgi:hypothetical protein